MAENEEDYLIRYKISMFMRDSSKAALSSATYSEHEGPKDLR